MADATPLNGHSDGPVNPLKHDAQRQDRVAVHSFDENASPAEKAAAAGKAREQLKPINTGNGHLEREVPIATGDSDIVPTITIEDAESGQPHAADAKALQTETASTPAPPGTLGGAAGPIPDWYTVGWRQFAGIDKDISEAEQKDRSIIETYLSEQYYGAWYHNAAIIVFAVFASHFLTRFGFGWGWLFILLAVCNTYYSTSISRVRRNARDDIQRELVKTRLTSEHESADWINNFLDRFWLIYEPVLSATIVGSVDQILSSNCPPFLESLRLTDFTLGTKAPRIDKVRTFPRTADDEILMDWGLSFTPTDISDLTPKQLVNKVNPKIVLSIRLGKGLATASMPILLENISFSGLMRIRLKLMHAFPHVQIVDISFLEKPVIDYVLKPIGGETFGLDIANIPGLSSFIRDMTHATLGPMMYDPNVFTLNLEQMLSGAPIDAAIGVLQVTIHSARGIKGTKIGGGTPDPFIGICLNNRAELAHTKYKNNTYNPTWDETKFILINSLQETLICNLWDYNDHRKNYLMGSANFDLIKLQEDATQENISTPILKDGKERGTLKYDVNFYPVLKAEEGQPLPDTSVGIVRLTIHQAKELDTSKSLSKDLNPLVKLFLSGNNTSVFKTKTNKHTNQPVWEASHEFLCADKASSIITLKAIDDRDFLKDPTIGYMSIRLEDLLRAKAEEQRDWFPLSNCKSGKIRISAEWKPLNMAGSLQGADQYKPPIGVVRLWLDKATDVKNVEAALGGKSDPYVRVQVKNETKGRTEVVNNNLNPVWDQIIYIPVHSMRDILLLECMDYQHLTRDRSLGSTDVHVSELAKPSDDKAYPYESTGIKQATNPLRQDKGEVYKGNLHFTAEFVPAMNVSGIKFEAEFRELQNAANEDDSGGSVTENDDSEDVPAGVTIHMGHKKGHTKNLKSTDTTGTNALLEDDEPKTPQTAMPTDDGIELSTEELLTHQSGIIIFNIVSGSLNKKAKVDVLLDDGYWPAFSTVKSRSTNALWEQVGEGFLKELDFGQVWFRLNESDNEEKESIIAEWKGDAKSFLKAALQGRQTYTLTGADDRTSSTITVEARYVPVPVKLEPRESVNNQGVLRVDLLDAKDLSAADRGGKSDPFALFTLNGNKVFKSDTKKKTLNPEWNEDFTTMIPSRFGANFQIEVFDWDQIGSSTSLGSGSIDLENIEPFESVERIINLTSSKFGNKGSVRLRLMFQPEIIAKSRKNTTASSTFSTAGRAMTQLGGLPVNAGKGVFTGVTGVFKKGFGHDDKDDIPPVPPVPDVPAGQSSHPIATDFAGANGSTTQFPKTSIDDGEYGTLRVTVVHAKDLGSNDYKPYTVLRVGGQEHKTNHRSKTASPEWNETFTFPAGAMAPKMFCWVHDHKTIGKDKLLGEGEVDIFRHVQKDQVSAAEVKVEMKNGQGLLTLNLEYDPTNKATVNRSSTSTPDLRGEGLLSRTLSISSSSPSRFSLRRKSMAVEESSD